MDDFIRREAAIETLSEFYHHKSEIQHIALREALNRVPTADVVEVVRCKDCRDYNTTGYDDAPGFDMAYVALKRFPAADVRPAKKAMCEVEGNGWTEHVMEYTDWRCHACGGFWTVCAELGEAFDKYSFCPRCGAELT